MTSRDSAPLPVGLIGLGKHGLRYLAHLRDDLPQFRLVAVSRRDREAGERTAAEVGARYHSYPSDLVSDPAVRAVIAVVPPSEHPAIVMAAIHERKPLLIEKPFAASLDVAFELEAAIERAGLPCLVGQTLRFSGVVQEVRARLQEIGRIHQIVLTQSFEPTRLGWLDDPRFSGGGNILHTGVHKFDLLRYLTGGEVTQVACLTERVTTHATEDCFAASLSIDVGAPPDVLATVAGSRATRSRAGEIRVLGERAQIVADHVLRRMAIIEDREQRELPRPPDVPTVREVLRVFHDVAEGRIAAPITPRDGVRAVAIADACYRSAASGRRERVRLHREER
jgi:predicted dehydrogenase